MESNPEGSAGKRAMQEFAMYRERPELKKLVVEASRALARLDVHRLEELALSCQMLNRALVSSNAAVSAALAGQAREAVGEMAVFAGVLEATRSNLNVMNRLRELRAGRLEYGQAGWAPTENRHGNN